jgi:hypothetical protein
MYHLVPLPLPTPPLLSKSLNGHDLLGLPLSPARAQQGL